MAIAFNPERQTLFTVRAGTRHGDAAVDRGLSGGDLPGARLNDVTHDHIVDLVAGDTGAVQGRGDGDGKVVQVAQVLQPWIVGRDADELVVAVRFVAHAEHADRAAQHEHPGEQRLPDRDHQRVERVAVLAQGVLEVAVVTGILRRGEQGPVEPDPTAGVVDLVLLAAAPRDLDEPDEHRRIQIDHDGISDAPTNGGLGLGPGRTGSGYARRPAPTSVRGYRVRDGPWALVRVSGWCRQPRRDAATPSPAAAMTSITGCHLGRARLARRRSAAPRAARVSPASARPGRLPALHDDGSEVIESVEFSDGLGLQLEQPVALTGEVKAIDSGCRRRVTVSNGPRATTARDTPAVDSVPDPSRRARTARCAAQLSAQRPQRVPTGRAGAGCAAGGGPAAR